MILSAKNSFRRLFFAPAAIIALMILTCFKTDRQMDTAMAITWSNICLLQSYDPYSDARVKKWDVKVTDDLFVRFRKTYLTGKQEYYSLSVKDFNDLSYIGTAAAGTLQLKTTADNVIEQTYNDPQGDEDNMVNMLSIPVKNMEPEKIDSLRMMLLYLKNAK